MVEKIDVIYECSSIKNRPIVVKFYHFQSSRQKTKTGNPFSWLLRHLWAIQLKERTKNNAFIQKNCTWVKWGAYILAIFSPLLDTHFTKFKEKIEAYNLMIMLSLKIDLEFNSFVACG